MKKKVFMYCRKSSESEDRQILSIDSQINELQKIAKRLGLIVVNVITESKSAKAPGRPLFSKMMTDLDKGEAEGVLCWKLDRLARNPIDGGAIIWAIKNNNVSIFTPSQTYSREQENQLLMYVEFGMAQKYIDDLGKNVKRGLNAKADLGWWPQHTPIGYANSKNGRKGTEMIVKDEQRFAILQKSFHEVASGRQAMSVYESAINDWGLTNPTTNKPIASSTFYKALNNPFYFGEFLWNDEWRQGKHEPMVSKDEFEIVQRMLGKKGKPVQRKQTFDLTGLFRCEECGCSLTASRKLKYYGETKRQVTYVYYHCTKKNRKIKCTQKPMTEKQVTDKVVEQLLKATPSQEFIDWAKKWIGFVHKNESKFQEKVLSNSNSQVETTENRLNKLLDLYLSGGINEAVYSEKKAELDKVLFDLKKHADFAYQNLSDWRTKVETTLDFARVMAYKFEHGTKEEKHQILIQISSDLKYKTKNPLIVLKEEFNAIKKLNNGEFETDVVARTSKYADIFDQYPDLVPPDSTMLPG